MVSMKTIFFKGLRIITVAITILLLGRMTGYAQSHEKAFLKRYDLSTTVINPDTAPTDEIYSWWTETAKKEWINYGNKPMDDRWLHRPEPLGFRGDNFQRFYIHFDTVYKVSPTVYQMEARSRCKDEICHIHGRILIDSVVTFDECDVGDDFIKNLTECGTVYAHYEMEASVGSIPVARLLGRSSYGYLVHNDSVYYDAMMIVADGYSNNQYAGKWVDLVTNDTLTCNWGDFRIPESKRLDGGCGLFLPGEEYYDLGWKPYLDWDNHAYVRDPLCMYYDFLYSIDEDWWKYEAEPNGKAPKVEGHYDYAHAFNYDLNSPTPLTDPVWKTSQPFNYESMRATAQWAEVLFGLETRIWKMVRVGWDVRFKFRITQTTGEVGPPWFIPGFGKNDTSGWGGTFKVMVEL